MIEIGNTGGFVVRTEAQKAAFDNGYRLDRGLGSGWLRYSSTTARGDVWIAGASKDGPWLLSLQYPDVAAEIGFEVLRITSGPGAATYIFDKLSGLHSALDRAYPLGVSLPDAPLVP